MYNMAGHGNSAGEWTLENSLSTVSRAVDELIDRFGKTIPIYVFAHSTGGLIALLAAIRDHRIRGASIVNIVTSVTDSYFHWHQSGYNQRVKEYFNTNGTVPSMINSFLDNVSVMQRYKEYQEPWSDLEFPYRYGLMKATSFASLAKAICFSPDLIPLAKAVGIPVL